MKKYQTPGISIIRLSPANILATSNTSNIKVDNEIHNNVSGDSNINSWNELW